MAATACGDDDGDAGDGDQICSIADNSLVQSVWPGSAGVFSLKLISSSPITGHTETGDNQLVVEVLDARGLPVVDAVITGVATTHPDTTASDAVRIDDVVDTPMPGTGIHTLTRLNYAGARLWQLVFTIEDDLRSDEVAGIEQCVAQDPNDVGNDETSSSSGSDDTGSSESNSASSDSEVGSTGSESGATTVDVGTDSETGTEDETAEDSTGDSGSDSASTEGDAGTDTGEMDSETSSSG